MAAVTLTVKPLRVCTLRKRCTHSDQNVKKSHSKVASFTSSSDSSDNCILCKTEKHPLYICSKFS